MNQNNTRCGSGSKLAALALLALFCATSSAAQTLAYRDFSFANGDGLRAPTGSKPESKVWFCDNTWWAAMFNPSLHTTDIYRLDLASQTWSDTGTAIDDRPTGKSDALWGEAGSKLYIVSNLHDNTAGPTTDSSKWGRLYRYSYYAGTQVYSLDSGFPVTVTKGTEETLVLAKDSAGVLWVAYVESSHVMVNHSNGADNVWGTPFILPVSTAARTTTSDDITSIIAFGGNKIGLLWSNQKTQNYYLAIHQDGAADTTWLPEEIATGSGVNCSGACSDDHINLKADSAGKLYVAAKTSFTGSAQPLINLLVRATDGTWSRTTYSTYAYLNTRGIVVLDEPHDRLYFFVSSSESGGKIDYKVTSMSNPSFADGDGDPFIQSSSDTRLTNATSSKQNVTSSSGLLVMASDDTSNFYVHNVVAPAAGSTPSITSFSPGSGSAGTSVVITGAGFAAASSVKFNGTNASSFSIDSNTQITAAVPGTAASGSISVTNAGGTATSAAKFTVVSSAPPPPIVSSFNPVQAPVGAAVTISGSNFTGATAVSFNTTSTASFTLNSNGTITVNVPAGSSSGPISVTTSGGGTGGSSTSFNVTSASRIKDITFENGNITDPVSGFDAKVGTVNVETSAPLKGSDSMSIDSATSYGRENYTAADEIFISLYVRLNAAPAGQIRLLRISDQGTTVGALTIETNGKLTLRNFVTSLGSSSTAMVPGTVYRIGIHQKKGTGSNAVLEGFMVTGDANFSAPFAGSSTQSFTTQADLLEVGATTAVSGSLTVDDIRMDSQAMPGPSAP